jgi:arylsulfatase A-like enzyme
MYKLEDIQLPPNFNDLMKDKPGLYRRTRSRFDQLTELEHRESIRHYLAYCTYEDELFGQIIDVLRERKELDNTLVIYLSDHGDYAAEHGLWCKGLPCFKSAYHIPAIVRWPEGIKNDGRIVNSFISLADFAPTILEIAGIGTERKFTGQSLVPFFENEEPVNWRDAIYTQSNGNELYGIQRSVMTDKWKYVHNGFDYDELYDLENDPYEVKNLASDTEYKEVIRNLLGRIWNFAYEHRDVCINSYITVALAPYGPGEAFNTGL